MKKTTKQQIERVLALADTTLEDLVVAAHKRGFTKLLVLHDDDGFIFKATVRRNLFYQDMHLGWSSVLSCGTGTEKFTETYRCSTEDIAEEIAKNLKTLTNQNKQ